MILRNRIVPRVELKFLPARGDEDVDIPDDGVDEASDTEDNVEKQVYGTGAFNETPEEREFTFEEPSTTLNSQRYNVGNILRAQPNLTPERRVDKLSDAFKLFLTPQMADSISKHTNKHAKQVNPNFEETDWVEIYAFCSISFMMEVQGDTKKKLATLWSSILSINFFNGVMFRMVSCSKNSTLNLVCIGNQTLI